MKYLLALALLTSNFVYASEIISLDCTSDPAYLEENYPLDVFLDVENEKAYFLNKTSKTESKLVKDDFFYHINHRFSGGRVVMDIDRTNGNFSYEAFLSHEVDGRRFNGTCITSNYKPKF